MPLEGMRLVAACEKVQLPPVRVAVRTGDTPTSVRAAILKHLPHILLPPNRSP